MRERNEMDRASEHLDRAAEHGSDAARHTGDAAHHTREAMEAGAAGTLERAADKTKEMGRKAGHVAERVSHAEADAEMERRAEHATDNVVQKAADAVRGAAPAVGKGAEMVVDATGAALSASSGVVGTVVGKIAGRVGGWWNSASEAIAELPEEENRACEIHFESYLDRPRDLTYEQARPAYTVGYMAARNPDYQGRSFEDVEPDLRHGFGEQTREYDTMRNFTRYGYERGLPR